jgi:2-haloacid dehalogenase
MSEGPVLVFDVNETLLSLEPIAIELEKVFGAAPPIGEWFARMLHGSLVANELDSYRPFDEIGVEALLTVAEKHGLAMGAGDAQGILGVMRDLPPHPEVYNAMERLFDADLELVALTNSSSDAANTQIENAGLDPFLQRVFSVEEVGRFKPNPAPYRHVAETLGISIDEMLMVAAHDWDCAGALAAGADAAFIKRPGVVWGLANKPPDLVFPDLAFLADHYLS